MGRRFTRRLGHFSPVRTPDGAGGYVETWDEKGALWCEVRLRSGGLKATEFGITPRLQVRILTHAMPQTHEARPWPGHRLVDGQRSFVVDAVQEAEGAGRHLTILATEVQTGEDTP